MNQLEDEEQEHAYKITNLLFNDLGHHKKRMKSGRKTKLTKTLNQVISAGVHDKQSLEVIQQGFLGLVCLKILYNWV